ncbi:MAG: NYN domain-containing protein [bacterium]
MSSQYAEQRVGVFVDVANMYYSAKVMYQRKVNFKAVLEEGVGDRNLIRAIAYVIQADIPEETNFFEALEHIGFEVKAKDLQIFYGGNKKGDWDVGIAMDTIKLAPKLDVVVIVSGDGDFVPLVHYLQSLGQKVEVAAFGRSASGKLREAVDRFIDLDKNTRKFLISEKRRASSAGPSGHRSPSSTPSPTNHTDDI